MAFVNLTTIAFLSLLATITLLFNKLARIGGSRKPLELIPGPPRLPLIGNLGHLRNMPHRTLQRLSQLYGPLMYVQLGQVPALVVSSAEIAQEVLKTQDLAFCTRPTQSKQRSMYYGGLDVAFTPYNEYWRQARKLCYTELLTEGRVRSFRSTREEEIEILKANISRCAGTGELVNVSDALLCFVDGIMCRQLFGKRFSTKGGCTRSRFHRLIHEFAVLMGHFNIGEYFPSMEWINLFTGSWRRSEANFREIDELLEEVIEMHGRGDGGGELEPCMAGLLLELQKDPSVEILSRGSIKGILMDLFIAGTDPSFAALEWGMSELLKNPRVMRKVQEELREVVGMKPKVEEADLPKLKYLNQVIREILRMHPPGPFLLPRESRKSCNVNGYEIPPKTRVVVNVWAISRDPSAWENPDKFCPERFEADSRDYRGQHFDFLPFGSGRRGCPGVSFAAVLMELALANLLHAFDWSVPRETMGEPELDMEELYGIVVHRKSNLLLKASPHVLHSK